MKPFHFEGWEEHIIRCYRFWTVFIHQRQCLLGRCFVALNRPGDFRFYDEEVTEAEMSELILILRALKGATSQLFAPDRFNTSDQGNEWKHCHTHFVPRYERPVTYQGITFVDPCPGHNLAQYDRAFTIPQTVLEKMRDDIRDLLPEVLDAPPP